MSHADYDDGTNVLVRCEEIKELKNSYMLDGGPCIGKSVVAHVDLDTNEIWIPEWLAKKEGLDYA